MIKQQIDSLLSEKMDRKKFFQYVGTIVLGVVGVTGLMKVLFSSHTNLSSQDNTTSHAVQTNGYGASSYGDQ
jgi:hypothetical protein